MTHALIIDENMTVSRAIKSQLAKLGFGSFDHTWTERQAIAAAERHRPDIVVIGDRLSAGSPITAARHLAERFGAPILMVAAGQCEVRRQLPKGVVLDGPFSLGEIGTAVALAQQTGPFAEPGSSLAA